MGADRPFFSTKFDIALGIAIVAIGVVGRNVVVAVLGGGNLILHLPLPRLRKALVLTAYFSLAAVGVLAYGIGTDDVSRSVVIAAGALGVFALFGVAGYLYATRHPDLDRREHSSGQ